MKVNKNLGSYILFVLFVCNTHTHTHIPIMLYCYLCIYNSTLPVNYTNCKYHNDPDRISNLNAQLYIHISHMYKITLLFSYIAGLPQITYNYKTCKILKVPTMCSTITEINI